MMTRDAVAAVLAPVALALTMHCAAVKAAAPADHAVPHTPETVEAWGEGARLFDGLGSFHRAVTTSSPLAQQYFDQGMRFLWAFNHDESTRAFAKAAGLDPGCASCYWGVALTVGPNYNLAMIEGARARVARAAEARAEANAAHATPVEQALIGALAARYPAAGAADGGEALAAYAEAMRQVAERFPDDLDVQTLCAEAQMTVHAWKLWTADGQPIAGTLAIESLLESVLERDPGHPGANHYYIHVMEASPRPERALPSAARLPGLLPAAGHLEHMPAHILQRVGRYEEAAEANRRGVAADLVYLKTASAPDYYPLMYLAHNYAFLAYSAAMEGRKAETLGAVASAAAAMPLARVLAMGDSGWNLTPQYAALVRFGLWDEMIAVPPPSPGAPGLTAGYLYARGVALAARGRLEEARRTLGELEALAATVPADTAAGYNSLRDILAVAVPVVAGRIAASEARPKEAVRLLEQAIAAEDRLAYDEPADWFFPVRHLLGAQLLESGQPAQAERVYQDDLARNPANGWALYGLAAAMRAEGRKAAAAATEREFARVWKHADVRLLSSAFWFAGPDTTSCECQRQPGGAW